jgi:hypothetical protein|tara:strand:- start:5474 stop:5647 length:174 start_codon:yes stop_codon:yes gene_type:complete
MNNETFAGWIAFYNNKRVEIKKTEACDLYGAKQLAIQLMKVPKSKTGLLAIAPAYND